MFGGCFANVQAVKAQVKATVSVPTFSANSDLGRPGRIGLTSCWPLRHRKALTAISGLALALAASISAASAETGPDLAFNPASFEFGELNDNMVATQTISIINVGPEDVQVARVGRTRPAFIAVSASTNRLSPGAHGFLTAVFNPLGLHGPIEEVIAVENGSGHVSGVPLRANVIPSYRIEGAPFFIHAAVESDSARTVLQIFPKIPLHGTLDKISIPPGFLASIRSNDQASGAVTVEITAIPPIPEGKTELVVDLATSDPRDPRCRFSGVLFLPSPVHVYPAHLTVAATDREQLRILFIQRNARRPHEITRIETPSPDITWKAAPGFSLEHSRVNVYLRNLAGQQGYAGDMVLATDDPERPEIRIPVVVDPNLPDEAAPASQNVLAENRGGCGCAN